MSIFKTIKRKVDDARTPHIIKKLDEKRYDEAMNLQDLSACSIGELELYITELYKHNQYAECIRLSEEIAGRGDTRYGAWARYAAEILYYGLGDVPKDMEKALYYAATYYLDDDTDWLNGYALGTFVASDNQLNQLCNNQQLMTFGADLVGGIVNKKYKASKKRVSENPTDESKREAFKCLVNCEAVKDLGELGYWNGPSTGEYVGLLLKQKADEGNAAAMYWLAKCHDYHIVELDEGEAIRLHAQSALREYWPALSELYIKHRDFLGEEVYEKLRASYKETEKRVVGKMFG